jgi:hypothetical protein
MSSILMTNSALVYEPKCAGGGGVVRYQLYKGAQINFGDLTPYLTYAHDEAFETPQYTLSFSSLWV